MTDCSGQRVAWKITGGEVVFRWQLRDGKAVWISATENRLRCRNADSLPHKFMGEIQTRFTWRPQRANPSGALLLKIRARLMRKGTRG